MSFAGEFSWVTVLGIDLPAVLVGLLACVSCALVGNFLVLRRQALMGDAISHVVLPGIVVAFLIAGSLEAGPLLLGALVSALVAVAAIEGLRRVGRLEPGAAMGVVFTTLFAVGIVLLERTGAGDVHLDVEHALYGNLESHLWLALEQPSDLLTWSAWVEAPRALKTLAGVALGLSLAVIVFWKELKLTTFDPGLAAALGFRPRIVGTVLMSAAALAAVASFEAVGSILVIAMFICPPATARMLTDDMGRQVRLSLVFAALSAVLGYGLAAILPALLGLSFALTSAGMIAVVAGVLQTLAMLFAPRYGALMRGRSA